MRELLADQRRIVPNPALIMDVGAHLGQTTLEYLDSFPAARVLAFEPEPANFAKLHTALAGYPQRVEIFEMGLTERAGACEFHVNSHNGTHSTLEIGNTAYWGGHESEVEVIAIETTTLDAVAETRGVNHIDIVKMDIQGGELAALRGGERLLRAGSIDLLALEVEFQELYASQPLFWDIAAYLRGFGYELHRLYDLVYQRTNPNVLCWADAIFLSPRMTAI